MSGSELPSINDPCKIPPVCGSMTVLFTSTQVAPTSMSISVGAGAAVGQNSASYQSTVFADARSIVSANMTTEARSVNLCLTGSTDFGVMWLDYLGVKDTLTAMSESCDEDYHIDEEIAESAKAIAEVLRKSQLPPPEIIRHGPRSAVFSWHQDVYALYLTIGSRKASVLATDQEGVIARASCLLTNPLAAHRLLEGARVQEADVH